LLKSSPNLAALNTGDLSAVSRKDDLIFLSSFKSEEKFIALEIYSS